MGNKFRTQLHYGTFTTPLIIVALLFLTMLASISFAQSQSLRQYVVNYTTRPPVQDGILSPGEYADASPAQGNFYLLGTGTPAPDKYTLQALWDEHNLYAALWCSDTDVPSQDGFPGDDAIGSWPGFTFKGEYEDVEFLFDPGSLKDNVFDSKLGDSYHIAVQLVKGVRPAGTVSPPYLFTAARYNSLHRGIEWNPEDIAVGVNLSRGITVEIAIPFSNLNRRYGSFYNAGMGEDDLEITGPPQPGDKWAFQVAHINSDGTVPVWNFHHGISVALHPYGIFTFAKSGATNIPVSEATGAIQPQSPFALPPVEAPSIMPSTAPQTTPLPPFPSAPTPTPSIGRSPFTLPPSLPAIAPATTVTPAPLPLFGAPQSLPQPLLTTVPAESPAPRSPFPGTGQPPFRVGMPPAISQEEFTAPAPATASPAPYTNYYTDLENGEKAIRQYRLPGVVFLTNPLDEANQRLEQIFTQPYFKQLLAQRIFIKIDIRANAKALSHYGLYKTPSVVLYDSEGQMRKKIQRAADPHYLFTEIQKLH